MPTDVLAPAWDLEVGGRRLGDGYRALVSRVSVEGSTDGADELTVEASAQDPDSGAYRLLGETILGPGSLVVASMGYVGGLEVLGRFRMVREEAEYPESGAPTVTLRGYSAEADLGARTKPWAVSGSVGISDVVRKVARDAGLTVTATSVEDVPAKLSGGYAKKAGKSDLVALQELAAIAGLPNPWVRYDPVAKVDVLFFRRPNVRTQSRVARFWYDPTGSASGVRTLRSFSPTLDLSGVPTKLELAGWDEAQQRAYLVVAEVGGAQEPTILRGSEVASYQIRSGAAVRAKALGSGAGDAAERLAVPHLRTEAEAVAFAKAWVSTRNLAFLTARAKVVGVPEVWPNTIHDFAGLAKHHAGLYLVDRAAHSIDASGYSLDLDLSRVVVEKASASSSAL